MDISLDSSQTRVNNVTPVDVRASKAHGVTTSNTVPFRYVRMNNSSCPNVDLYRIVTDNSDIALDGDKFPVRGIAGEKPVFSNIEKNTVGVKPSPSDGRESAIDLQINKILQEEDDVENHNLLIEKGSLDTDRLKEVRVDGRRVVDISFVLDQLHEAFDDHHPALQCHFRDLKLIKTLDSGMRTKLTFKCQMCNYIFDIWTDPEQKECVGINESAVCGTITAGTGYSTLEETLAAVSVPSMSAKTYRRYRDIIYNDFHEIAEAESQRAASLERKLAIEKGHVINGIPYITVVADGCWAKRSYVGGKYNSLSGAAMIFGAESRLALHVGVRNKYCAIHARAVSLKKEPPPHVYYKNWGRDESSTAMETDIIVEGFKTSIESNGLIFRTLIADGGSSVYQVIRDVNPYADYGVTVEKIECNNHLFRNLCRKLRSALKSKLANLPEKGTLSVTELRQCVQSSGLKIRNLVECARDLRNSENSTETKKATRLCKDILIISHHVFGDNVNCSALPFACEPEDGERNIIGALYTTNIYPAISEAVRYLSSHAKSLLKRVTNNVAESCNSIVNKLNSGKRINHCAKNSYQMRCYGAFVQHNTQSVLSKIYLRKGSAAFVQKLERRRRLKNIRDRRYKVANGRKCRRFKGTDKDYGPSAKKPDMEQAIFDVLAEEHMTKLRSYQSNRKTIERDTVSQNKSDLWHQLRTELITASKFGPICRKLPTTSCANLVGFANEDTARRAVELKIGKQIVPCGLFLDSEIPYLGASPDGLIDDDGIVEIKCPFSAKDISVTDAIKNKPNLRNIFDKKRHNLNKNHAYFYQVQGQLHITMRKYCIFAMWTSVDVKLLTVLRDDAFWESKMKSHLCRFYLNCILPEIIDSRRNRNMPLRDPDYILEARERASRRKADKKTQSK